MHFITHFLTSSHQAWSCRLSRSGRLPWMHGRMTQQSQTHLKISRTVCASSFEGNMFSFKLAVTMAQVHQQLAEEELAGAKLGEITAHEVSLGTFISTGLELEEYQYVSQPSSCIPNSESPTGATCWWMLASSRKQRPQTTR